MTGKVAIEVDGEEKTYPSTDSLKAAGLYLRAYGDVVHKDRRCAGTKFVLDLGGSLGLYRDTTGNGDLFYFPLAKQGDSALYKQEGGSTEHTWDKLAQHLSTVDDLGGVHVRLAQVLSSEFKGKLGKSEVIAIGAMLADAKYSIRGWLYAVEQLKAYKFDGKTISTLFAITGKPFWKYSLNASNKLNEGNHDTDMGRRAGLGYKALDDESNNVKRKGVSELEEPNLEKKLKPTPKEYEVESF